MRFFKYNFKEQNKLLIRTLFLVLSVTALIFASIMLFQHFIDNQKNDGTIINLAGRQRMLSQKITKTCLLISANRDFKRKAKFFEILREDLKNFTLVQNKLIHIDNSRKIINLFDSFQKKFQKIANNAQKIMRVDNNQQQKHLLIILQNEAIYLKNMDIIVDAYTSQNRSKILYFKKLFILAHIIIIIFLVFIVFFIVNPSIKEKHLNELKLKQALLKEKELGELKLRFISTASHEFRTPLSAINFAAGSMKKYWAKMGSIMIENKLTKIENQVGFMVSLLDDVLLVGQAEAGKIRNYPLTLNLGEFIDKIIEEVYHSSKKSHKILLIDTKKLKSTDLFIDEKLGRNIFVNLLSNAIKFSPNADEVKVEMSLEKDYTIISVIDFGIGILESEIKNIFTPFTRGKNVDLIQGTGLGLSIVKEALEAMEGKIIVNSTLGNGTTFIVKIPKKQTQY